MKKKKLIVIAGPTAVGKTALSIQLAETLGCEILSSDSRQCYREMNIGVAKPSPAELDLVKHHFINSHSIHENVNVGIYEQYALATAANCFESNDYLVVVGGTGLYIKALCEGIDSLPAVNEAIRLDIQQKVEENGLEWLANTLQEKDPLFAATDELKNKQRMMRALEIYLQTGKSIRSFQLNQKKERPFDIIKFGVELPKPELHDRIHRRVDLMMQEGLLEEVQSLQPFEHLNALQTVGYREFFEYLKGNDSLEGAIEKLKTNTRRYAKRQMTWFKADAEIEWIAPNELSKVLSKIK